MSQQSGERLRYQATNLEGNYAALVDWLTHQSINTPLNPWVLNSLTQSTVRATLGRNLLAAKMNRETQRLITHTYGYLEALTRGFLSRFSEKGVCYVPAGKQKTRYPLHTPAEAKRCIDQLVEESYGIPDDRLLSVCVAVVREMDCNELLNKPSCLKISVGEELKKEQKNQGVLWETAGADPAVYADTSALQEMSKKRPNQVHSVFVEQAQMAASRCKICELPAGVRQATTHDEYRRSLQTRLEQMPSRFTETTARARQSLVDGVQLLKTLPAQDARREGIISRMIDHVRFIALQTVRHDSELSLLPKLIKLSQDYELTPIEKLKKFMSCVSISSGGGVSKGRARKVGGGFVREDNKIPVFTVSELRRHIEFLKQHLKEYCEESVVGMLDRWSYENPGQSEALSYINSVGEETELAQREKKQVAQEISQRVFLAIEPIFSALDDIDLAENNLDKVRGLLEDLQAKLACQLSQSWEKKYDFSPGEEIVFSRGVMKPETIADQMKQAFSLWENYGKMEMSAARRKGLDRGERLRELFELAPGPVSPEDARTEGVLCGLYHDYIEAEEIKRLLSQGLIDYNLLLRQAVQFSSHNTASIICCDLLDQGAEAGYEAVGVNNLDFAYSEIEQISRSARNARNELDNRWGVYALLLNAQQLSVERELGSTLLDVLVGKVIEGVAQVSGGDLSAYRLRDGEIVKQLVRSMILLLSIRLRRKKDQTDLAFRDECLKEMQNTDQLASLCGLWAYLLFDFGMPQTAEMNEKKVLARDLKAAILKPILAFLVSRDYHRLPGVKLLGKTAEQRSLSMDRDVHTAHVAAVQAYQNRKRAELAEREVARLEVQLATLRGQQIGAGLDRRAAAERNRARVQQEGSLADEAVVRDQQEGSLADEAVVRDQQEGSLAGEAATRSDQREGIAASDVVEEGSAETTIPNPPGPAPQLASGASIFAVAERRVAGRGAGNDPENNSSGPEQGSGSSASHGR